MGMNINRGFFNFDPNWANKARERAKSNPPEVVIQKLEAEELKPDEPKPGNMQPRLRPNGTQPSLEEILKNLDHKGFGQ